MSERGATRSGQRFAPRNTPYHPNLRSLLLAHKRLLSHEPAISIPCFSVGSSKGTLIQATARYRADHPNLRGALSELFSRLFKLAKRGKFSGPFEVVVTFNVVLANRDSTSYTIFYGHDYAKNNYKGSSQRLQYSESSYLVRDLTDVKNIPTSFDFENLIEKQRRNFESSDVRVVRILNVVYLVYQYSPYDVEVVQGILDGEGSGGKKLQLQK